MQTSLFDMVAKTAYYIHKWMEVAKEDATYLSPEKGKYF